MDLTKRERIRNDRVISWVQITFGLAAAVLIVVAAQMAWGEIPRTADGKPDLSGYYDTATITPLERRSDEEFFSEERAEFFAARAAKGIADGSANQDPNREAPPVGGDGSPGAAGNVGGYDSFWVDPGERNFQIDGKYRSSIVIDPPNGRRPPLTDEARQRQANQYRGMRRPNDGTAWWLENDGPGPYDGPEIRPFPDRCLMGFGSTGGPPMLPTLYNNHKRIVQTPDPRHDPHRDGPRRAHRAHQRRACDRRHAALVRRLDRLVGRRHAGDRHRELQRHAEHAGREPEPPRRRALQPH